MIDLCKFLISKSSNPNDTVLDCFMGSGTTGISCKNLNRKFIGIELNKEIYDIAEQRINKAFPCNVHSKPEIMREWYED